MRILNWLVGQERKNRVTRYTITDKKNGKHEFVGSQRDYETVYAFRSHVVISKKPYERPWWKFW